jgi:hypothetical protein
VLRCAEGGLIMHANVLEVLAYRMRQLRVTVIEDTYVEHPKYIKLWFHDDGRESDSVSVSRDRKYIR